MPEADVVVVGAGIAGLCAALEAGRAGASVTVLEAHPECGGASVMSGGASCLVSTALQTRHGVTDDLDLALADWLAAGQGAAHEGWAREYLGRSNDAVFEWVERLGVSWTDLWLQEGNSVPRQHLPAGGGAAIVAALLRALTELDVRWRLSTRAEKIARSIGGTVDGIVVRNEVTAACEHLEAQSIVVTTGGFANSGDMLATHMRHRPPRVLRGGAPQATGTGHRLLADAGGELTHMEDVWLYPVGVPNPRDPSGCRGLVLRGIVDEIWVNQRGLRFHNEDLRGGASGTPALLAQPGGTSWGIFDARAAASAYFLDDAYYHAGVSFIRSHIEELLNGSPYVSKADTVEALAESAGLPIAPLCETVAKFNSWCEGDLDREPEFGRSVGNDAAIVSAPFFAVRYFPLAQKTLGGVATDLRCNVLDSSGAPISGLFAAGEVAGMAGGHINGRGSLEGTMFGPSLFSGRVAGAAAAGTRI